MLEHYLEHSLPLGELGIKGKKRKRKSVSFSFLLFLALIYLQHRSPKWMNNLGLKWKRKRESDRLSLAMESRINRRRRVFNSCIHVSNRSHFSRQITRSGGKRIREVWAIEPSYQQSTMSDRSVDDCRPAPLPISPTDMSHFPQEIESMLRAPRIVIIILFLRCQTSTNKFFIEKE